MPRFPVVGDDFAGYRITGQLGMGGMGVVFAAEQRGLGRTVALKVLAPQLAELADYRERFAREAAVLASLDSPHVIAIFDHGEHDGCLYIATQYVAGGDLSEALRQHGPMPTAMAAELAGQVAWALSDAHAAGVVHRDIKPSNVLLRLGGTEMFAYLCDFGIALNQSLGVTATGSVAGTFAYLSPERLNGEPATPAADIYALGCVLWTSLTGATPYTGTDMQIALSHLNAPVPQVQGSSSVAGAVNRVLQGALTKNPAQRYPSAGALRADLDVLEKAARRARHPEVVPVRSTDAPRPQPGTVGSAPSGVSAGSAPSRPPGSPPTGPPPSGPPPGLEPPSPLTSPAPPAPRRRTGTVVAGVVAVVLAIGGGVGAAIKLGGDSDPAAEKNPRASQNDTSSTPPETPTTPTTPATTASPEPSEPTSTPTRPAKPKPKPFYPEVPAASGPTIRLGAASLNAPAGWGTIDDYRFDGVDGAGARNYNDRSGIATSVYIYRSEPRFPLSGLDPETSITLLNTLALGYVKSIREDPTVNVLVSAPLKPAWLDGVRASRLRAGFHDNEKNRDFAQETWFVPRGKYLYRIVFENDRFDSLDLRRGTIDPSVVSFRFAG